jgi:lipopolysaccharide biosynthesis regulator YciM
MRWLLIPIMRPIAKRRLVELYADQDRIQKAINSARKSRSRVSDLYELAKRTNCECHRWERWT